MSQALLRKLEQAFNYSIRNDAIDIITTGRPFFSALAGIDDIMRKASRSNYSARIRDLKIMGGKAQWPIQVARPQARGVNALTGELNSLIQGYSDATTTVSLTIEPSYYEVSEAIRVAEVDRYEKAGVEHLTNWVMLKTRGMAQALADKVNEDIFPGRGFAETYPNFAGSTADGAPRENKVMGLGWGLQTGQEFGATGTATAFSYCGLDIGSQYVNARAIQYGTTNGAAVPITQQAINNNIILPASTRGVVYDLCLVPSTVWAFLTNVFESQYVQGAEENLNVGARTLTINGIRYLHEPGLDMLAANGFENEMYFLKTDELAVAFEGVDGKQSPMEGRFAIREVDGTSLIWNMTGAIKTLLVNFNPRAHAIIRKPAIV